MQITNSAAYMLQHLAMSTARQNDQLLLERLGIGFSQFKILMVLQKKPHVQQKAIAETLGQTEASISRQIKLMHDKGLLSTSINPANRRERMTTLTGKGDRLIEEAFTVLNGYYGPMFDHLGEKKLTQLIEILADLHGAVCQPGKIGACDRPFNT